MDFVLIEESGFEKGTSCKLSGEITIGRDSSNSFQVLDNQASRVHARMTVGQDNSVVIEDLSSTNGTFVNEKGIKKETICPGDKIRIGNTILAIKEIVSQSVEAEPQPFIFSSDATSNGTIIQKVTCPACSKTIKSKWKFCPHCGAKIK